MRKEEKKFFAFDTETDRGRAFICSFANSEGEYTYRLKNKSDMEKLFEVLVSKEFGNVGFCFNLDYDVIALWRWFDKNFCEEIYLKRFKYYNGIRFEYIPKKFLKISANGKEVYIFELMQYFPGTLDNAGKKYLGIEKMDVGGKEVKKNIFFHYKKNPKKITRYCELDAKITYLLAKKLDSMIDTFGLELNKYYSCGYLAKKYLDVRKIHYPKLQDKKILQFVKPAYFGGRIEFVQRGFFKNCYQYDINSAYPYACAQLPYITDYFFSTKIQTKIFYADCDVNVTSKMVSPLAYRDSNLVVYPKGKFRCTLDCYTFERLAKKGFIKKVYKVLNVVTDSYRPFYDTITKLYKKRLITSKEEEKYIIKIILNSLYGKFAEKRKEYVEISEETALFNIDKELDSNRCRVLETSFGFFRKEESFGKNSNLIYASLITANIRNLLYDTIIGLKPDSYIGSMTDCIFTKELLTKNVSEKKELGKFSLKEKGYLYVVGSGVYQSESGTKFRGYKTSFSLVDLAKKNKTKDKFLLGSTERKSLGKLVVQGIDWEELNVIYDNEKQVNLNFDRKRIWEKDFKNFGDSLKTCINSKPLILNV